MPALPFDAREIEKLVLRLNAVTAKEGTDIPDLGGNATDDAVAETLQEVQGDLSRDEITHRPTSGGWPNKQCRIAARKVRA